MGQTPRYCIIGAGFCGLGAAKAFKDYGIPFDCLERNQDVGGNWLDGVYDSTHLISSRDSTQYADFPMPREYPDFPNKDQMLNYFRTFVDHFNLRSSIQFSTEVKKITPLDPKGMSGWKVELANGETRHYIGVIIANGHHWNKRIPQYPGNFTGKTIHSKDYKNTKDFTGQRVLVVGAGNSGCDIAVESAHQGFDSLISMRRGYYFIPKTIFGTPVSELDKGILPLWIQKLLFKGLLKLINGPNSRYGIQEPDHDLFDHHPIVNSQLMYFARHGKVRVKPDIERLDGQTVFFKDGSKEEIDTIVWATGFNVSFPFMDHGFFEWENGYPKRVARMMAPDLANLYVFGLAQPRGGAGPLITQSSRFIAETVLAQERLKHPISNDFARYKAADAKVLVGVCEAMKEIQTGRNLIKKILKKNGKNPAPPRAGSHSPKGRNLKFPFSDKIPKNWLEGDPLETNLLNALILVFPAGERYFIRAVRAHASYVKDPILQEQLGGFYAQEVQHGREHERCFDILKAQGFKLDEYLKWYNHFAYDWLEPRTPKILRLAKTAAIEHYTAAFGEYALRKNYLRSLAHPVMADLFCWHAAEEIEHKAVAYDVLMATGAPYPMRILGLICGTATLGLYWASASFTILNQDAATRWTRLFGLRPRNLWRIGGFTFAVTKAFCQYLRPGFHPSQIDNMELAKAELPKIEATYLETPANPAKDKALPNERGFLQAAFPEGAARP